MSYKLNLSPGGGIFAVPNSVVDEGLRLCGAAQLKVLLLLLRENGPEADPAALSEKLGIPAGDVADALEYWRSRGLLTDDRPPEPAADAAPIPAPAEPRPDPIRKKPTMAEVEQFQKSDAAVAFALRQCEAILGKAFSSSDTATLVWLMEWAGVPADVLVTVAEYCRLAGKTSLRYIEKTALGWLDSGIDTIEAADERIKILAEQQGWEGALKSTLGIGGRALSDREREFSDQWRALGFSQELLRAAFQRTLDGAGKLSFPYMNKILQDWKRQNITTPEQAAAEVKPGSEPSFDVDDFTRRIMLTTPSL